MRRENLEKLLIVCSLLGALFLLGPYFGLNIFGKEDISASTEEEAYNSPPAPKSARKKSIPDTAIDKQSEAGPLSEIDDLLK